MAEEYVEPYPLRKRQRQFRESPSEAHEIPHLTRASKIRGVVTRTGETIERGKLAGTILRPIDSMFHDVQEIGRYQNTLDIENINDYKPIFLYTHAEFPNPTAFQCTSLAGRVNVAKNPHDLFFKVPENFIVLDPIPHGGACIANPQLDNAIIESSTDLMRFFKGHHFSYEGSKHAEEVKEAMDYLQQNIKVYSQGNYIYNYNILFEETSAEEELEDKEEANWGVFELNEDKRLVPIDGITQRADELFRATPSWKPSECVTFQDVITWFKLNEPWRHQKLIFYVVSCRDYPKLYLSQDKNTKNVPLIPSSTRSLLEEAKYTEKQNFQYLINLLQTLIVYLTLIPVIVSNGFKYSESIRRRKQPKLLIRGKKNPFFYVNREDVKIRESLLELYSRLDELIDSYIENYLLVIQKESEESEEEEEEAGESEGEATETTHGSQVPLSLKPQIQEEVSKLIMLKEYAFNTIQSIFSVFQRGKGKDKLNTQKSKKSKKSKKSRENIHKKKHNKRTKRNPSTKSKRYIRRKMRKTRKPRKTHRTRRQGTYKRLYQ